MDQGRKQIMRTCFAGILGALLCLTATAAVAQVDSVNLWNSGIGGYETYRVPGVVTTKHGILLAYCGARKELSKGDWSPADVLLRRSTDSGKTWEPSRKIAGNGVDLTDNVVAIPDRQTGSVVILYQKNYLRVFEIHSEDDGKTFSPEVDITPTFDAFKTDYDWNVVTPGTGHGIQLKSGRLLASIWIANGAVHADGTRGHAPAAVGTIYSDDHGHTWHRGAIVARDSEQISSPNETVAAQLSNGKVMVNIRSGGKDHLRAASTSDDGISNWTPLRFDPVLFDPTCDAGILSVPASKGNPSMLYFSNPDSRDVPGNADRSWRARQNMTIKVSADDGATWTHQQVIDPGVAAYSDLTSLGENIFVIYESGPLRNSETKPDHIIVARISKTWLQSGPAPEPWTPQK
jgi:sialidase-1